jgi:hypothetical protein
MNQPGLRLSMSITSTGRHSEDLLGTASRCGQKKVRIAAIKPGRNLFDYAKVNCDHHLQTTTLDVSGKYHLKDYRKNTF